MTLRVRLELTKRALEVGALLNTVENDDQRELLQEQFEQTLNHELYCGSQNRKLAGVLSPLRGPSVSSDPRDGYALNDPKRLGFEGKW